MTNALSLMAARLEMDPTRCKEVLQKTAFSACKNDEQFAALVVVANVYRLNPLLKEIYAFPGKGGEIVPMVGVDGWLRIINDHPQMNGLEVVQDETKCTVTIYRKDRSHPTVVTEWLDECRRPTEPWKQAPRRMLRHKAIIQAGRVAFGFGGIHDEDDAEAILSSPRERNVTPRERTVVTPFPELPVSPEAPAPASEGETRLEWWVKILSAVEAKSPRGKTYYRIGIESYDTELDVLFSFSTTVFKIAQENIGTGILAEVRKNNNGCTLDKLRVPDAAIEEQSLL